MRSPARSFLIFGVVVAVSAPWGWRHGPRLLRRLDTPAESIPPPAGLRDVTSVDYDNVPLRDIGVLAGLEHDEPCVRALTAVLLGWLDDTDGYRLAYVKSALLKRFENAERCREIWGLWHHSDDPRDRARATRLEGYLPLGRF